MDIQLIKEIVKKQVQEMETIVLKSDLPSESRSEYEVAERIVRFNRRTGDLKDFFCPICKNKGEYADVTEVGEVLVHECCCMAKRRAIENSRSSGLTGIMLSKTFENFEQTEAWQKSICNTIETYANNIITRKDNSWLCVLGQSGVGKSHLCCAAVNKFIDAGAPAVYMTWNNAVKELKRNATDEEAYSKLRDKYEDAEVLYIDDLFKGKVTETDVTIAFELINYRYNNPNCITIISSELRMADLFKIDEAISGRILERIGKNLIQIKPDQSKNYRRKGIDGLKSY